MAKTPNQPTNPSASNPLRPRHRAISRITPQAKAKWARKNLEKLGLFDSPTPTCKPGQDLPRHNDHDGPGGPAGSSGITAWYA